MPRCMMSSCVMSEIDVLFYLLVDIINSIKQHFVCQGVLCRTTKMIWFDLRECVQATLCLRKYDKVLCVWSGGGRNCWSHHECSACNSPVITLALSVTVMLVQLVQLSPSCLPLNSCKLTGPGRWCSWAPCLPGKNQSQSWQDHSKSAGAAGVVNRQTIPTWPLMSSFWKLFFVVFLWSYLV